MKIYFLLPFALLVGLVVGGWGVRVDLREARDEIKDLKREIKSGGKSGRSVEIGQGVTSLLNIDNSSSSSESSGEKRTRRRRPKKKSEEKTAGTSSNIVAEAEPIGPAPEISEQNSQERFQENIERAVELYEMRARVARATFVDRNGLDEEQAQRFDVLVDAMNVRLAGEIEKWVEEVEAKEDLGAEDGIKLVNGVTEALVTAYDDLDRDMPEGWRENSDGEMEITDFIDPGVAMPLVRVQGMMEGGSRRNRRSEGGGIIF